MDVEIYVPKQSVLKKKIHPMNFFSKNAEEIGTIRNGLESL